MTATDVVDDVDLNGRPWAKLSELKEDDVVELDDGFACMTAGTAVVKRDERGLYVLCGEGEHHLTGHADDGEHLVGIYRADEKLGKPKSRQVKAKGVPA